MSYPNIPNISPSISITREQVINLLLASIAMEELGLSHIINAEGEKLQYVLGTLENGSKPQVPPTVGEVLEVNESVDHMLRTVAKKEMLLGFKLEDIMEIPNYIQHVNKATVSAIADNGATVTDSDYAYYYTVPQEVNTL